MLKKILTKIRILLNKLNTVLSGLKVWDIYLAEYLQNYYEDPKCPLGWHGSGCYDIEVYALRYHRYVVCARTEEDAERIYHDHIASLKHSPFESEPEILGIEQDAGCDPASCNANEVVNSECSCDFDQLRWSEQQPTADLYEAIESF